MKSFKKFAFLTTFPLLLIGCIAYLINSFDDFKTEIILFTIGYFAIIAFNYVYIFEKLQLKSSNLFKNYLLSIFTTFLFCSLFALFYQCILFSEIRFFTLFFQGLLGIVIFILEFSILKIASNHQLKNNLRFTEKPLVYFIIIGFVCFTESLFLILFSLELLQLEDFNFLQFIFINFLQKSLMISSVSMFFLYLFSLIKFSRNNLFLMILFTTTATYLSFFAFKYAAFKPTIIINHLVLAFSSTLLSAIIILYRNNKQENRTKIVTLTSSISKKESEYLELKNQVNPHFLFNNLNTLISFIEIEPKKAIEFGHHLSNVYRYYLKNQTEDFVSLTGELHFITEYLEIYKAKFEAGFAFEIEKNLHKNEYILALSLQEIIDNIFKHNILDDENPIQIKVFKQENHLMIKNTINLQNNVVSNNTGLANINLRHKLLINQEITISKNDIFFEVRIPIIILEK